MNGNLVSPTHVLANAEVVEILTYDVRTPTSCMALCDLVAVHAWVLNICPFDCLIPA